MTVLQNWSGQENMPVEQNKKNNKLLKHNQLWEIDEHLMNIDHHHHHHHEGDYGHLQYHQQHHQRYPPPHHHLPDGPDTGGQPPHHNYQAPSQEYNYENDSYNNNNNVKFSSSMVAPPMRRYSTGMRVQVQQHQPHQIPNGHLDEEQKTAMRYEDPDSLGYVAPPPKHHVQPYRQNSSPDIGSHMSRRHSEDYSESSNYWKPTSYPNPEMTAGPGNTGRGYSLTNNSVPDGYGTVGRTKKGVHREIKDFPLRKSADSSLFKMSRSQSNGLHLINGPEFLAHSLALSSSTDGTAGSVGSDKSGSNGERVSSNSNNASPSNNGWQTKPILSNTVTNLPQHDLQVHQERSGYLKQSTPLSQTQPLPKTLVVHSAPATPLGETFPGFTRQYSNNSGSSTPTSSIGGDIPTKKQPSSNNASTNNKSPLHTISESIKSRVKHPKLGRSNSTPNILEDLENDMNNDDDIDKDDYGFLSYRSFRTKNHPFKDQSPSSSSASPSAMHKSTDGQTRTFSRKWKKSKLTQTKSVPTSSWKPQGHCTWSSVGGKRLVLTPSHLLQLTEFERIILQKLAHCKLQSMGLGCPIVIPKDSQSKRSKSRMFSIKKRSTSSSGLMDSLKDRSKDTKDSPSGSCVFGMTLTKVLVSDRENGHRCPCPLRDHKDAPDFTRSERKWSTSSGCGLSTDSMSESDSRSTGSTLLDALSLSSLGGKILDSWKEVDQRLQPHTPHIPYIMHCCLKHLENYGLNVVGIFRKGPSKKRVKQLREEFDSGQEVALGEDAGPHEVGALLKEFLRDLPDPLLTRDLYAPFLATTRIKDDHKRLHTLRLLVSLLPTSHRDALFALLRFLHLVTQHSTSSTDSTGQTIPGNKMDANNLATLFSPNVLHKSKVGEFQVESPERAEQRNDIISVLKEMIDSYVEIFELPNDVQDEVYRSILESDPEALDVLLRRKCQTQGVELEVEVSSLNEENDLLSSSLNSESLRPRTQSDVSSLPLDNSLSSHDLARLRPRTYNEAVAIQQKLQQHIQQHHNAHLGDTSQKLQELQKLGNVLMQDTNRQQQKGESQAWDSTASGQLPGNNGHLRRERVSSAQEESQSKPSGIKQIHRLSTPIEPSTRRQQDYRYLSASPKPSHKHQGQNVHIKVTPETTVERPTLLSSMKSMLSPRPTRKREDLGSIHTSSSGNHLTVPSFSSQRTNNTNHKDNSAKHASNSSLSSGYFGGSSRSGTTSPVTPEHPVHNKWYLDTPPETPPSSLGPEINSHNITTSSSSSTSNSVFDFNNQEPGTFHRTSSLQRPLGVAQAQSPPGGPPHSPRLPPWQQQRWKHWEEGVKQRSDELKQQETLV